MSPGLRATAISAFWFSIMGLAVKLAGRRLPSMEIVLFRAVITLGLSYVAVRRAGLPSIFGTQRRLLLMRGLLGSLGLVCFYFSLVHLPLGEATLIQYTNPIFAVIIAGLWVGERLGKAEFWSFVAAIIGVVLITRPAVLFGGSSPPLDPRHVLIAVFGAFCSGFAYATVRKLGPGEHPAVIVFYLPLVAVPIALPFAGDQWLTPRPLEWLILLGVGVSTQIAQVYMTKGLQAETAARATTVGYLQVAFAGLWGALLLGEHPTWWTMAGAALIIGSASYTTLKSRR